jgi:hypothetical protein
LELLPELDGAIVVLKNGDLFVLFYLRNGLYSDDEINLFLFLLECKKMS